MTPRYTVTLLQEAVEDLRRLEDFSIERELASETPDWTTPQRALVAIREGMRVLSWSPFTCRRAELGNGRSRELIAPFGGTGHIVLLEIVDDNVIVGAVRHQREEDYRHFSGRARPSERCRHPERSPRSACYPASVPTLPAKRCHRRKAAIAPHTSVSS